MHVPVSILLVDDSDLIASRVSELFHGLPDFRLLTVKDIESAKAELGSLKPDVVLLDISLNGSNGIDLLKFINESGNGMPVIMLTNQVTRKHRELCIQLGCYAFLDKTTEFEKIIPLVSELLYQR